MWLPFTFLAKWIDLGMVIPRQVYQRVVKPMWKIIINLLKKLAAIVEKLPVVG